MAPGERIPEKHRESERNMKLIKADRPRKWAKEMGKRMWSETDWNDNNSIATASTEAANGLSIGPVSGAGHLWLSTRTRRTRGAGVEGRSHPSNWSLLTIYRWEVGRLCFTFLKDLLYQQHLHKPRQRASPSYPTSPI